MEINEIVEKLKYYTGSNVAKRLLYLIKVSEEKTK